MSDTTVRPGQEHFVAPLEETPLRAVDAVDDSAPPSSQWGEAWRQLRRRPLFWASVVLIALVVVVAAVPSLFTSTDPRFQTLADSLGDPREGHPFGFTRLGEDVYARTIYGARASVVVGLLSTVIVTIVGGVVGAVAGYYGGIWDALLSRISDIFFAVPLVLGAIVLITSLQSRSTLTVSLVLSLFAWPQTARIMRGSVLQTRSAEFVTAARALGLSRVQVLVRHVVPNALGPVIVIATISLGTFIAAEATLSYLGVGLPSSIVSWGGDISAAQTSLRSAPQVLFWPAGALSITVLSFIMLGDVVRDALDPKARTR
ncbi:ABC transporter permease subunit [Kineococcus sp. R8]|uniref:ABC transporter permease n=1 Tax=Kineococcus siccus TaxID=2696567 RepID=UPI0014132763|nr:ABC transporter permease [Kineococcus siccus]NAZ81020.1 ABC transporter permease subunit [Kineococcus siccus]